MVRTIGGLPSRPFLKVSRPIRSLAVVPGDELLTGRFHPLSHAVNGCAGNGISEREPYGSPDRSRKPERCAAQSIIKLFLRGSLGREKKIDCCVSRGNLFQDTVKGCKSCAPHLVCFRCEPRVVQHERTSRNSVRGEADSRSADIEASPPHLGGTRWVLPRAVDSDGSDPSMFTHGGFHQDNVNTLSEGNIRAGLELPCRSLREVLTEGLLAV